MVEWNSAFGANARASPVNVWGLAADWQAPNNTLGLNSTNGGA